MHITSRAPDLNEWALTAPTSEDLVHHRHTLDLITSTLEHVAWGTDIRTDRFLPDLGVVPLDQAGG
jgi:hypothetical protein